MNKWILGGVTSISIFAANFLSADEVNAPMGRDQGMWQTVVMIGIAVLFFYFILWRPEQKRRKILDDQRNAMKKGDKVTAMGILGTISQIKEHTVILRMYDGAKIEVLKGAINDVTPEAEAEADSDIETT